MSKPQKITYMDQHFGKLSFSGAWEGKVWIPIYEKVEINIDVSDFSSTAPKPPTTNQQNVFEAFCENLPQLGNAINEAIFKFYKLLHKRLMEHEQYNLCDIPDVSNMQQVALLYSGKPSLHILNQHKKDEWRVIWHQPIKLDKIYCVDVVLSEKGVEDTGLGGDFYNLEW